MSISGSLSDIAVVDLLQFVHLSQRSGTLLIESSRGSAHISFQRGRIACAWAPTSISVVKHLVDRGILSEHQVAWAEFQRQGVVPVPSLGKALLDADLISLQQLRDAVAAKIEQTIFDLISWSNGTFRLIADEIQVDEELTFAPGEVLPDLDIDTQSILLEAVRLFDERNRSGRPRLNKDSEAEPLIESAPSREAHAVVQLVSKDPTVLSDLATGLAEIARVDLVEMRDAGAPVPGNTRPLVVVDYRLAHSEKGTLRRIRELHPTASAIAIVGGPEEMAGAFSDGAIAVAEPRFLMACCANLLRSRLPQTDDGGESNLRSGLGRLRRALNELRSGLLSATVSLNLMSIVADSVERAVLFILQRNALVALGAFGTTQDGRSLATTTRGLAMHVDGESAVMKCLQKGHALSIDYGGDDLPPELKAVVDSPRSGQGVFFPVLGARRAIGIIYADNGRRSRSIKDVELMELATAQVGLAFENELLRRQLSRFGSGERSVSVSTKGTERHVEKNTAGG